MKNKELILKVAFSLFLQKGYKSVSIKDIIEGCNLSKGAIYHHFVNKEKILFEALDKYFFETLIFGSTQLAGHTFREQLEQFYMIAVNIFDITENLEEGGIEYPIKSFYNFQLECENFAPLRDKLKEATQIYRKIVEELVQEAIDKNELRKGLDAEIISFQIIGMIEGLGVHHSTLKSDVKNVMTQKYKLIFDNYLELIKA